MLETKIDPYTIKKKKIYAYWRDHFSHLFFFFQDFPPISDGSMGYGIYNHNVAGFITCLRHGISFFKSVLYDLLPYSPS